MKLMVLPLAIKYRESIRVSKLDFGTPLPRASLASVAQGITRLPVPCIATHRVEVKACMPAQLCLRQRRVGIAARHIARTSRRAPVFYPAPAGTFECGDHFQYRIATTGTEIVDPKPGFPEKPGLPRRKCNASSYVA